MWPLAAVIIRPPPRNLLVHIITVQDRLLQGSFDEIMPTPGLCRVGLLARAIHEGSLILVAALIGIITGFPGKRARRLKAGSGQERASMGWRVPALVP